MNVICVKELVSQLKKLTKKPSVKNSRNHATYLFLAFRDAVCYVYYPDFILASLGDTFFEWNESDYTGLFSIDGMIRLLSSNYLNSNNKVEFTGAGIAIKPSNDVEFEFYDYAKRNRFDVSEYDDTITDGICSESSLDNNYDFVITTEIIDKAKKAAKLSGNLYKYTFAFVPNTNKFVIVSTNGMLCTFEANHDCINGESYPYVYLDLCTISELTVPTNIKFNDTNSASLSSNSSQIETQLEFSLEDNTNDRGLLKSIIESYLSKTYVQGYYPLKAKELAALKKFLKLAKAQQLDTVKVETDGTQVTFNGARNTLSFLGLSLDNTETISSVFSIKSIETLFNCLPKIGKADNLNIVFQFFKQSDDGNECFLMYFMINDLIVFTTPCLK